MPSGGPQGEPHEDEQCGGHHRGDRDRDNLPAGTLQVFTGDLSATGPDGRPDAARVVNPDNEGPRNRSGQGQHEYGTGKDDNYQTRA